MFPSKVIRLDSGDLRAELGEWPDFESAEFMAKFCSEGNPKGEYLVENAEGVWIYKAGVCQGRRERAA